MMFAKRLRDAVREGRVTCSVRVWQSARVKVGGRYKLAPGHIVVESVREIVAEDVTDDLARRSGFDGIADLMATARHGAGENIYLVEFHYSPLPVGEGQGA